MNQPSEDQTLLKEGADSIFQYIKCRAEEAEEGIRWQTLTYDNKSQYSANAYNGISGVSLFLSDYYYFFGSSKAKELSCGALEWCTSEKHRTKGEGLYFGMAGIGMACLRFSVVSDNPKTLNDAEQIAGIIQRSPPGPGTEFFWGAAGRGIFMLRLFEATKNERYLSDAIEIGDWLDKVALRNGNGCIWLFKSDDTYNDNFKNLSFGHGTAGIGYFFILLYGATLNERWRKVIEEVNDTLGNHAKPDKEGHWGIEFDTVGETAGLDIGQWCNGAPGVGLFYTKAYEILKDPSYLEIAKKAAQTTLAYGDWRKNPSQCHGLAGNGELFIELYLVTMDDSWLNRAIEFARRCFSYRQVNSEVHIWQADEAGLESPDFMCGAAGTGHFFLRLLEPGRLRIPLL